MVDPGFGNIFEITNKEYASVISGTDKLYSCSAPGIWKISNTQAVIVWFQDGSWNNGEQPIHAYARLVSVSNGNVTTVDTAKHSFTSGGTATGWDMDTGLVPAVQVSDTDAVMGFSGFCSSTKTYTPDEGIARTNTSGFPYNTSGMTLGVRVRVENDTVSFVWVKKWGAPSTSPVVWIGVSTRLMIDPSDDTLVLTAGDALIRINPSNGSYIEYVGGFGSARHIHDAANKGNKFIACCDYYFSSTYFKGTIGDLSLGSTEVDLPKWNGFTFMFNSAERKWVRDTDGTWLAQAYMWRETGAQWTYWDFFVIVRFDIDENGDMEILNVYGQDCEATYSNPDLPEGGKSALSGGTFFEYSEGYTGDHNRVPTVALGNGAVATVVQSDWQSPYSDLNVHAPGLQCIYGWGTVGTESPWSFAFPKVWTNAKNVPDWNNIFLWEDSQYYKGYQLYTYIDAIALGSNILVAFRPDSNIDSTSEYGMYCTVFMYASEPPPLKLSQRDDDMVAGGKRIAYTPQNGNSQRIGWQAY